MPRPLEVLGSRRIDKRIELDGFVLLASEHWNHELDSQSPTSTLFFPACVWAYELCLAASGKQVSSGLD